MQSSAKDSRARDVAPKTIKELDVLLFEDLGYGVATMNYVSTATNNLVGAEANTFRLKVPETDVDIYFSADVETDGPIPGPFSILSFAIVYAGHFNGKEFVRPNEYGTSFYRELRPISDNFQPDAMRVNGLDREALKATGVSPSQAMDEAFSWVTSVSRGASPVLVAYPLSFDWTWLYWYFVQFSGKGSPFGYSHCYDIKTAVSIKGKRTIASSGRSKLPSELVPTRPHTHHALDDAIEQAEIFANVFEWEA